MSKVKGTVTSMQILKALDARAEAWTVTVQTRESAQSLVTRALSDVATYKAVTDAAQALFETEGKDSKKLSVLKTQVARASGNALSLTRGEDKFNITNATKRARAGKAEKSTVIDIDAVRALGDEQLTSIFAAVRNAMVARGLDVTGDTTSHKPKSVSGPRTPKTDAVTSEIKTLLQKAA